ncbi:TlpA disulfide reductase family protein [Sphingobacterium sp. 2149]|uniref:TlpA disulfide reductase family protein n=1 Tax=Sphingobacterium sp. 2149 TaxID=2817763 RepID=UPI0028561D5A|nr:TlpA disulfide reductase family protein [Sphingobacterium sp. 2149]MDR6733510.1 thiol-disulfide isomerase/thioredoxin [Sphingobacterium sp. 2149]
MKNIFRIVCLALAFLPIGLMAQRGFTVSGEVLNLRSPAKAYLLMVENERYRSKDSVDVVNGRFRFTGKVDQPERAMVSVVRNTALKSSSDNDYIAFFIENSAITLKAQDSIKHARVEGSVAEDESKEIEDAIKPLSEKIIQLNNKFAGKTKDEAWHRASDSVARLVKEIKQIRTDFVRKHFNTYMGLDVFYYNLLFGRFNPEEMEPLFQQFSSSLRASKLGVLAQQQIIATKRGQVGVKATYFKQMDLQSKLFDLASLRGKYVLIDFWASWCAPCRAENPHLIKAYAELKDKNFEIVGVSLDSNKDVWEHAVKQDGLPWIHVCDLKGWKNEAAVLYGISSVPQNFLLDPNGVIIGSNLRGEDVADKISKLIK